MRSFPGHLGAVNSVAAAIDGRHVLSGGDDQVLRLWEIDSGREVRQFKGHTAAVKCLALSFDGRQAVSGGADNAVRLWDVATGRQVARSRAIRTPSSVSPSRRTIAMRSAAAATASSACGT